MRRRERRFGRAFGFVLALIFIRAICAANALASNNAPNSAPVTMVHLFNWPWNDIAEECENTLSRYGYDAVQVSPPQEHAIVPGRPWYERYQPVSPLLTSRSGSETEFAYMITRCNNVGVRIVVDAVVNHMAWRPPQGQSELTGSAGSRYGYLKFPSFSPADFHQCRSGSDLAIRDYQNRTEVHSCELAQLPDLKTGSAYVQQVQGDFLTKLADLGVSGFRIDAAKHIPVNDLKAMLAESKTRTWTYSEVIGGRHEAVKIQEYLALGSVTDFDYSSTVSHRFQHGSIADLKHLPSMLSHLQSDLSVVFVDNHDNQRGHGPGGDILTFKKSDLYRLANVFMLTFGYGTPLVMSSYFFTDPSQGPPQLADGSIDPPRHNSESSESSESDQIFETKAGCGPKWVCEHRWTPIRNATLFRSLVESTSEKNVTEWNDNGSRFIAFSRGQSGFVAINAETTEIRKKIKTSLPPGQYCNGFLSDWTLDKTLLSTVDRMPKPECEQKITVGQDSHIEVSIPPLSAIVLHTNFATLF